MQDESQEIIQCLKKELEDGYKPTLAHFFLFLVHRGYIEDQNGVKERIEVVVEDFLKWKQ